MPRALGAGAAVLFACAGFAFGQTNPYIHLYNGGRNSVGFDAVSEGVAWSKAGLLDRAGRPLSADRDGNLVNSRGRKVAEPVTNARDRTVGYKRNSTYIYNMAVGRLSEAFEIFNTPKAGTARIRSHGTYEERDGRPGYTAGDRLGGEVFLDRSKVYGGFAAGTSLSAPYDLAGPEGGEIRLDLYNCWSRNDPDDAGPIKSVTKTAKDIRGVSTVTGSNTTVYVRVDATPTITANPGRVPLAQIQQRYQNALARKAKARYVEGWLADHPFRQQYAQIQRQFGTLNFRGGKTVTLAWKLTYSEQSRLITESPGEPGPSDFPVSINTSLGGPVYSQYADDLYGIAWIQRLSDSDADDTREIFQMTRATRLPAPAPNGEDLATPIFQLAAVDGFVDAISGMLEFQFDPTQNPDGGAIHVLQGSTWTALPTTVDFSNNVLIAPFDFTGVTSYPGAVVAGFGRYIPAPSGVALAALTGALAARRRR